jgi:hypothetical protein
MTRRKMMRTHVWTKLEIALAPLNVLTMGIVEKSVENLLRVSDRLNLQKLSAQRTSNNQIFSRFPTSL